MNDERQQDNLMMLPVVLAIVIVPMVFVVLGCGGFLLIRLSWRSVPPPAVAPAPTLKSVPIPAPQPKQSKRLQTR